MQGRAEGCGQASSGLPSSSSWEVALSARCPPATRGAPDTSHWVLQRTVTLSQWGPGLGELGLAGARDVCSGGRTGGGFPHPVTEHSEISGARRRCVFAPFCQQESTVRSPCPHPLPVSAADGRAVWTRHSQTCSLAPSEGPHPEGDKIEPCRGGGADGAAPARCE